MLKRLLNRITGKDDGVDLEGRGTVSMPGPSPRRMRQVNPINIDINLNPSRMDALPAALGMLATSRAIPSFEKPMEMMKKGGKVKAKKMTKGGQTGYRKAADGCATKGKTRGRMV